MKTSLITMFRVWRLFNLWSSPEPGFVSSSYFNLIAIPTRHWPLIGPLTPDWPLIGQQFPEELDFNLIAQSTSSLLLLDPDRGHNGAKTPIWFFSPAPILRSGASISQTAIISSESSCAQPFHKHHPFPLHSTRAFYREMEIWTRDIVIAQCYHSPAPGFVLADSPRSEAP